MPDQPAIMVAIGTPDPDGAEALQTYVAGAGELAAANGAKPIGRFKFAQPIAGPQRADAFPALVAVLEFPSAQALHAAFDSDAYKQLIPARDKGFKELRIFRAEPA